MAEKGNAAETPQREERSRTQERTETAKTPGRQDADVPPPPSSSGFGGGTPDPVELAGTTAAEVLVEKAVGEEMREGRMTPTEGKRFMERFRAAKGTRGKT